MKDCNVCCRLGAGIACTMKACGEGGGGDGGGGSGDPSAGGGSPPPPKDCATYTSCTFNPGSQMVSCEKGDPGAVSPAAGSYDNYPGNFGPPDSAIGSSDCCTYADCFVHQGQQVCSPGQTTMGNSMGMCQCRDCSKCPKVGIGDGGALTPAGASPNSPGTGIDPASCYCEDDSKCPADGTSSIGQGYGGPGTYTPTGASSSLPPFCGTILGGCNQAPVGGGGSWAICPSGGTATLISGACYCADLKGCVPDYGPPIPYCGNGTVDGGEQCDAGPLVLLPPGSEPRDSGCPPKEGGYVSTCNGCKCSYACPYPPSAPGCTVSVWSSRSSSQKSSAASSVTSGSSSSSCPIYAITCGTECPPIMNCNAPWTIQCPMVPGSSSLSARREVSSSSSSSLACCWCQPPSSSSRSSVSSGTSSSSSSSPSSFSSSTSTSASSSSVSSASSASSASSRPSSRSSTSSSRSSRTSDIPDVWCPANYYCGARRNAVTDRCEQIATTTECGSTGTKVCNGPSCLSDGCASQCCACLYPVSSSSSSRVSSSSRSYFSSVSQATSVSSASSVSSPITPTFHTLCGNNALEAGEECEKSYACPSGRSCNPRTCKCVPPPSLPPGVSPTEPFESSSVADEESFPSYVSGMQCGNGVVEPGEQCDEGERNATLGSMCSSLCELLASPSHCGDHQLYPGEQCDDGNALNADGCSRDCLMEPSVLPRCGDNSVQPGEQCDNGALNGTRRNPCNADCTLKPPCGNSRLDEGETCDDSNMVSGDGCSAICQLEPGTPPFCGDGIVEIGEQCDEGAENSDVLAFRCRTDCSLPRCGDSVLGPGEQCDEGIRNGTSGSPCDSFCRLRPTTVTSLPPVNQTPGIPSAAPTPSQYAGSLLNRSKRPLQTQTGPAAIAIMASGAAAGWAWMRRKRRKKD